MRANGPARQWHLQWASTAHVLAHGSPAEQLAARQGFVLTHDQARQEGMSDPDVRRLVRNRLWTAPRRGVLCVLPAEASDDGPRGSGPAIDAAALALVRPDTVISHESAAAFRGLPYLRRPSRPSATMRYGNGGGQTGANVHAAALVAEEIEQWFGVYVTCAARTVVDIARGTGLRAGLVIADAALNEALTSELELDRAVRRAARWPGVRRARRAVELASPMAESPLESLTRLVIVEAGLPAPELQVWIDTGARSYRVDALWRDRGVVLEADGMLKYRTPADLVEEKRRQEDLERAGYRVVRVTWDDVWHHPERTAARIRTALRLGGHPLLVPGCRIWA